MSRDVRHLSDFRDLTVSKFAKKKKNYLLGELIFIRARARERVTEILKFLGTRRESKEDILK